jgi:hypothetical protein
LHGSNYRRKALLGNYLWIVSRLKEKKSLHACRDHRGREMSMGTVARVVREVPAMAAGFISDSTFARCQKGTDSRRPDDRPIAW